MSDTTVEITLGEGSTYRGETYGKWTKAECPSCEMGSFDVPHLPGFEAATIEVSCFNCDEEYTVEVDS